MAISEINDKSLAASAVNLATNTVTGVLPAANTVANLSPGNNLVINGNFDVWQRGTSFSNVNNVYTADRFKVVSGGGTTGDTVSRQAFAAGQTDVPGNPTYYLRYAAGSSSSNKVMHHRIEDVRNGAGETCTLSFYAKASTSHTSTAEVAQVFGSGGSSQVTQSPQNYAMTTSWQKFTFTISLPSISGKTIGTSSYIYIAFIRSLPLANTSIDIAQMQFEVGTVATPFNHRSYGQELALCHRYYWNTYNGAVIGSNTGPTHAIGRSAGGQSFETIAEGNFPTTMRAVPTMQIYNPVTGTAGSIRGDSSNFATCQINFRGVNYYSFNMAGVAIGQSTFVSGHVTADAEL